MDPFKLIKNGIIDESPTFVQCIGLCPTLAVTTSARNGIGMGLAATAVLLGSNIAISAIRRMVPDEIRIPIFIVVIAGFVTVVQLLIKAFAPDLDQALGIFIPLIVVNCIILARAEAFASKNGVVASALDGIGMGLGFALALFVIGCVRELLGTGAILGTPIMPEGFEPGLLVILAPGGFISLGVFMALFRLYKQRSLGAGAAEACGADACAGCAAASACGFGAARKEDDE